MLISLIKIKSKLVITVIYFFFFHLFFSPLLRIWKTKNNNQSKNHYLMKIYKLSTYYFIPDFYRTS